LTTPAPGLLQLRDLTEIILSEHFNIGYLNVPQMQQNYSKGILKIENLTISEKVLRCYGTCFVIIHRFHIPKEQPDRIPGYYPTTLYLAVSHCSQK
jgi:hypothetical protein